MGDRGASPHSFTLIIIYRCFPRQQGRKQKTKHGRLNESVGERNGGKRENWSLRKRKKDYRSKKGKQIEKGVKGRSVSKKSKSVVQERG